MPALAAADVLLFLFGQPGLASEELSAGIPLAPSDPDYNFFLGRSLFATGKYREAIGYLQNVPQRYSQYIEGRIILARSYAVLGENKRAEEILNRIQDQNPLEINSCIDLAKLYEGSRETPTALTQWQRCYQIYRSNPQAYGQAGEEIGQALQRLQH